MIGPGPCPHCGAPLDAETKVGEARHGGGGPVTDVGVCIYCARLLILEDGARRRPTEAETDELLRVPELVRVLRAVREHGPRSPGGRRPR